MSKGKVIAASVLGHSGNGDDRSARARWYVDGPNLLHTNLLPNAK